MVLLLPGHRETLAGLRPVRRAELITALGFLGLGLSLPEIRAASGSYRGEVCWASSGRESRASSSQCTEPAKSVGGGEVQGSSDAFGPCNETLQAGWLINNKHPFPTVLEAKSPRSGHQRGRVLVRILFWVTDFSCPPHGRRGKGAWGRRVFLFYESPNPIDEGLSLVTRSSPKGPTS